MKTMNRVSVWLMVSMLAFATACNEEEIGVGNEDIFEAEDEAMIESGFDEIEDLAFQGIFETSNLGGKVEQDGRLSCAVVTKVENTEDGTLTVTIDFGDGCTGPNERTRKGMIIITHNGRIWEYGSEITISLVDFSIDGVQIEGTRTITNTTSPGANGITHHITLVNGKITWPNESSATREADMTRTWYRSSSNPSEDTLSLEGSASGNNRNGVSYTMEITSPILFKRNCRSMRVHIPVSGEKEIQTERATIIVNFGDGTCDKIITVTVNGTEREVVLD